MNKYIPIVFCLGLILLSACKKDDKNGDDTINFKGITATDMSANIIVKDNTDWRSDDSTWSGKEYALLGGMLPRTKNKFNYQVIGYPNPCYHYFNLFRLSDGMVKQWQYCIVDKHYKVLQKGTSDAYNFTINADSLYIKDTVRVYYRIVYQDSAAYGHGDIVIAKP